MRTIRRFHIPRFKDQDRGDNTFSNMHIARACFAPIHVKDRVCEIILTLKGLGGRKQEADSVRRSYVSQGESGRAVFSTNGTWSSFFAEHHSAQTVY